MHTFFFLATLNFISHINEYSFVSWCWIVMWSHFRSTVWQSQQIFARRNDVVKYFSNFFCMFLNPNFFPNLNSNCSNLSYLRNLQEQVEKAFCYQKLFWPFTVWINCSSDLKNFANSRPSASNFKKISRSLDQFIQTVKGQNNFW